MGQDLVNTKIWDDLVIKDPKLVPVRGVISSEAKIVLQDLANITQLNSMFAQDKEKEVHLVLIAQASLVIEVVLSSTHQTQDLVLTQVEWILVVLHIRWDLNLAVKMTIGNLHQIPISQTFSPSKVTPEQVDLEEETDQNSVETN